MELGYEGRRVLVVGASYGIGFSAARQMASEGADLVLASRDMTRLSEAAAAIARGSPGLVALDVTLAGSAERLAQAVRVRWGALDALVCAVGGSIRSAFQDLKDDDWLGNYAFNVLSAVRVVREALPLLRKGRDPAVVLLAAAAAKMPYPHQVVSNVHKAGLLGLSKTLAAELAPEGIRVNCVCPGRTLTPLWLDRAAAMAAEKGVPREEIIRDFSTDIPLGRFAEPDEIAVMVTWLASPRASYITGQAVNVDGGIARGLL